MVFAQFIIPISLTRMIECVWQSAGFMSYINVGKEPIENV